ncbi:MAG: DNA-3-methyladenine glycosylase 2 family protein [Pseudomonadota bacterium]
MNGPARAVIRQGCEALAEADPALARAYECCGVPVWRTRQASFETLARMIAYQQISTKAGATIWGRVEALVGEMAPAPMLSQSDEALRATGLSRAKVSYVKAVAAAVDSRALCFDRLGRAPRREALSELTAIKGIGPWSAEIFLMSTLGDLDAFPPGDVGLMESYRLLAGAPERPSAKAFGALAAGWSPWRGVATHLLWAWVNAHRAAPAAPVDDT